jgi:hypothetical protein
MLTKPGPVVPAQHGQGMRDPDSRGLTPNTLSSLWTCVRGRSAWSVTWSCGLVRSSADALEPRRMRPELRPTRHPSGADPRPSANERSGLPGRVIRSKRGWLLSCVRGGDCPPTLLSPLLSVAATAACPAQTPPPNPTAAGPGDGLVQSSSSLRVHEPLSFTRGGCPAVTDGLDGFRESQILLRRVRGRTPTLPPALRLSATPDPGIGLAIGTALPPGETGSRPIAGARSSVAVVVVIVRRLHQLRWLSVSRGWDARAAGRAAGLVRRSGSSGQPPRPRPRRACGCGRARRSAAA